MSKIDIKNFYKAAVERKEFNSDFWNEVKKISTEGELKAFIEEKVQPVSKKMGYDFSTKDLLDYEKQMERKISEQQLETVSGGVSAKNLALGGIFSLMALGAGIVGTTNSASAELTTQDVAKSTEIMETAIAEEFENPKILPIQGEKEIEEAKKDKETSQTNVDKSVNKKDVKIQATKSWYRNWLYLTTDSNSTETLTLTRSMLESFLKEAGFNSIYEIQAIQARNAKGEILDVKLDKDLGKLFSESKEIPGKLWGTWGKANAKKDIPAVDTEQTVAETPSLGAEQSTVGTSDLGTVQAASDISDLETAKAATDVDPKEVFETRKLTDEQQLYAYEALDLQEAYALLKSGVVENVRFCGNITEIETKNGSRLYSEDSGDDFTELLCILYPSPAGTLNTNTRYKGKDSFAKYGGMSPELAAKFFAILEDYRNKKIEIPKEFKDITLKETRGEDNLRYVNPEFRKALAWLKVKGLLAAEDFEKVKAVEDAINRAEELKESLDKVDIDSLKFEHRCIDGAIKYKENLTDYFDSEIRKLENEAETNKAKFEIIEKLKSLTMKDLKQKRKKLKQAIDSYPQKNKELQLKVKSIKEDEISKKAKFLMHFINIMKEATKLEVTDDSSYPKYLTEHILMSYMCQTLNGSEDVQKLYREIAEQLSQNETNKTPTPEEEKAAIVAKIAAKKEELSRLNDIINEAEFQELSPYKSATQSNAIIPRIGSLETDGNMRFQEDIFADCADIAARHVINLLTFTNEQNWDLILKEANMEDLNAKLKEVVDAIENKNPVKFYDLKTRLQMFFLYQRGFIEGVDNEEDVEYRSKNGADDVTPLARILWEYVICNMNKENLEKGPDKNKGLYPIVYTEYGLNHELKSGCINVLKLMWNMASVLNPKSETLGLAKSKIDALSGLEEYNETAFKEALNSTFSLFYTGGEIEFTPLPGCQYRKINGNNEVIGIVKVDIIKGDQRLNFTIMHDISHGAIKHNPIKLDYYKHLKEFCKKYYKNNERMLEVLEKYEQEFHPTTGERVIYSQEERSLLFNFFKEFNKKTNENLNSFAKLLFKRFIYDTEYEKGEIIFPPGFLCGFYEAFSGEELESDDAFRNTDLYKKYKALSAFKILQGEENNVDRINQVIDIDTMRGAKEITVIKNASSKQQATEKKLSDIIYERYLKKYENKGGHFLYINSIIRFYKFGEIEEIYDERGEKQKNMSFDIIKINEGGEVQLFIKNTPENGELIIPLTVYDKNVKEYKVTRISKYSNTIFENLKMIKFTGNFDNLTIESLLFLLAKNLQTVEINGNGRSLIIGSRVFEWCMNLKSFTIRGNVENLTIDKSAFKYCENLKSLTIRGDVENLNLGSEIVYDSSKAKIFLPENLKNKIPERFKDKNKIIFYDTTDDGTLHLRVNEVVSEISLDKETLETLGENFQNLRAMGLENAVEIIFDDDLKDKFLKVEDETGLHYERKKRKFSSLAKLFLTKLLKSKIK